MDWCSKHWGCHQIPERSYFVAGYQFPVCARCTGVALGYITGIVCLVLRKKLSSKMAGLLILPMSIDGGVQYVTSYESENDRRTITGFFAGIGFIYLANNIVRGFFRVLKRFFVKSWQCQLLCLLCCEYRDIHRGFNLKPLYVYMMAYVGVTGHPIILSNLLWGLYTWTKYL